MKPPSDGWDKDERDALEGLHDELEAIRARHANDPPLELLRAARGGALPDRLEPIASEHLSRSAWSRSLVEGLENVEAPLRREDEDRILARVRKDARATDGATRYWSWLRQLPLPVAAAAALVLVAWVSWRAVRPPPASSTPETRVAVATPPQPAAFQLPLEKPEIRLSAAALTWRGARGANDLLSDLKPAFDAFRQDDYTRAARELEALEPRYPGSIEIVFYEGVSRLFLNDSAGAIAALEKAERLGDSAFAPDVAWYRALAEQRAGHMPEARARLDALCRGGGARASRACEARQQLR